jgi:hypothetical protein
MNAREELIRIRADLLGLEEEAKQIEATPPHPEDLAAEVLGDLEVLAQDSKIRSLVRDMASPSRPSIWVSRARPDNHTPLTMGDLAAILGPAAVAEGLMELVAQETPRGMRPLKAAERAKRLEGLAKKRRELETAEERAVMALEDEGQSVPRRAEFDPELLLELWK